MATRGRYIPSLCYQGLKYTRGAARWRSSLRAWGWWARPSSQVSFLRGVRFIFLVFASVRPGARCLLSPRRWCALCPSSDDIQAVRRWTRAACGARARIPNNGITQHTQLSLPSPFTGYRIPSDGRGADRSRARASVTRRDIRRGGK